MDAHSILPNILVILAVGTAVTIFAYRFAARLDEQDRLKTSSLNLTFLQVLDLTHYGKTCGNNACAYCNAANQTGSTCTNCGAPQGRNE